LQEVDDADVIDLLVDDGAAIFIHPNAIKISLTV
jgi:hypothetical protein